MASSPGSRAGSTVPPAIVLVAILVVYAGLAGWYSATIPLGEAPDEVPHFTYMRFLAQRHHLPTTTEEHEAFQPPLYYAAGALLTFWIEDEPDVPFAVRANADFDGTDPRAPKNLLLHSGDEAWRYRGWALAWHTARLLSIVLGGVTVWAVYRLGRVFFPERDAVPLLMAALTAFTPQFLFMSSVVNNDNAATAFSALVLWQVCALLRDSFRGGASAAEVAPTGRRQAASPGPAVGADGAAPTSERTPAGAAASPRWPWKRSLLIGLFVGLGLLSKANLIALVPIAGLAILVACGRMPGATVRRRVLQVAGCWALAALPAVALAAWYFIRNWRLYGDPLGWSFLLQINALREGPLTAATMVWLFKGVFRSFWLGWIGIAFDPPVYWLLGALCLVGGAGFAGWLRRQRRTQGPGTGWALALLALHALITVGSLIQWTATVLGTDQGRLIYPLLPTAMLILAAGWAWWVQGRARPVVLAALAAGMLTLAILAPVRHIGPVHAPAPAASPEEIQSATPLGVSWGDMRLLGYRLESTRVQPRAKLILHLYWEATRAMDQDLMALIQLVDGSGKFLMYTDGSPTAGRDTTDRWPPGRPLASRHLLPIPDYGRPGGYRLTISVHPFGEQQWLPAVAPDGSILGDQITLPETIEIVSP